ncbi:hypothetical protein EIP86_007855 [Pleurotus ostreatoroseus]|nr:hypothetical protein EIP86_007855 [Pleurotus ostreatoroseus]
MCKFLREKLDWRLRRGTRPGQKIPVDATIQLTRTALRIAIRIRDNKIPAELIVNTDQTQALFASTTNLTYERIGSKQVAVANMDEKRAFTLVVGVSLSGEVLPFQAIYAGSKRSRVLPKATAPHYDVAQQLGFCLEPSMTSTYWATQETMRSYVRDIVVPYFNHHKRRLGLKEDQQCIWYIDVWSVHRSEEFRTWLRKTYPWIRLIFVPAGCTALGQPCDVGIQRPLKHTMRRTAHAHIVHETLKQLQEGTEARCVALDKSIGVLRDRSIEWMVNGYKAINKPDLVKKAWELCEMGPYSLSYDCLTGLEVLQALRDLAKTDPEFFAELSGEIDDNAPSQDGPFLEDTVETFDVNEDDSSLPLKNVIEATLNGDEVVASSDTDIIEPDGFSHDDCLNSPNPGPSNAQNSAAGSSHSTAGSSHSTAGSSHSTQAVRRSGRARTLNRRYQAAEWIRFDDDSSDEFENIED